MTDDTHPISLGTVGAKLEMKGLHVHLKADIDLLRYSDQEARDKHAGEFDDFCRAVVTHTATIFEAVCTALVKRDLEAANRIFMDITAGMGATHRMMEAMIQRMQQGLPAFPKINVAQLKPADKKNGKPRILEP